MLLPNWVGHGVFPGGRNILVIWGFFFTAFMALQFKYGLVSWELSEWIFMARNGLAEPGL
jgi:hypothetical protein